MKNIVLAVSILAASAVSASAADMAARPYTKAPAIVVAPSYSWSGWYVGVNAGGSWSTTTGDRVAASPTFAPAIAVGQVPNLNAKHDGYFGGGQAGYNWQVERLVFGVETDIQGADIGRSNTTVVTPPGLATTTSTGRDHIDWFGTFRGRLGFAINNVLFYGTGGAAYGGVKTRASDVATPIAVGSFAGSSSNTRFGWVAGAGVEWGFAPNWSLKGEYLHIDLGTTNVTALDPAFPTSFITYRFRQEMDTFRLGINYRFGGAVVAKY
ncbi:outer membrane beta-barrel protein [Bradyrhizobium sp. 199]|uniref:outer membrane protein n=1 Tax=Bradyrhizobium sp. 199 TaxID=2782664 RepID=UPI001FF8BB64|nr:outer membrane beta-barrel protein [Bradyrhizobium sp. 199]MCK1358284.1 porin family protein [Bradyrhizobium sp. 199]